MCLHRWRSGDPTLFANFMPWVRGLTRLPRLLVIGIALCGGPQTPTSAAPVDSKWESDVASGPLRVCIWPDYRGVSFRDPRSGLLSGIDIDLAEALAVDLGKELVFVDSSFARLVEDIQQSRCDVAMFAVGITAERQRFLRFSAPYMASDIYAIALRNQMRIRRWEDIDQAQIVVAVARGTLHESWMPRVMRQARMVVLDSPSAREQEVRSGRADVFLTDYPFGVNLVREAGWAQLIAAPGPMNVTPYAYASSLERPRWAARIDRFVADIKSDGRLRAAAAAHGLEAIIQP